MRIKTLWIIFWYIRFSIAYEITFDQLIDEILFEAYCTGPCFNREKAYSIPTQFKTWSSARKSCKKIHRGFDLMNPTGQPELDYIMEVAKEEKIDNQCDKGKTCWKFWSRGAIKSDPNGTLKIDEDPKAVWKMVDPIPSFLMENMGVTRHKTGYPEKNLYSSITCQSYDCVVDLETATTKLPYVCEWIRPSLQITSDATEGTSNHETPIPEGSSTTIAGTFTNTTKSTTQTSMTVHSKTTSPESNYKHSEPMTDEITHTARTTIIGEIKPATNTTIIEETVPTNSTTIIGVTITTPRESTTITTTPRESTTITTTPRESTIITTTPRESTTIITAYSVSSYNSKKTTINKPKTTAVTTSKELRTPSTTTAFNKSKTSKTMITSNKPTTPITMTSCNNLTTIRTLTDDKPQTKQPTSPVTETASRITGEPTVSSVSEQETELSRSSTTMKGTSKISHYSTNVASTADYRFCNEITFRDIKWPKTAFGSFAEAHCPKGEFGSATWLCDETTKSFDEKGPRIDCKDVCSDAKPPKKKSTEYWIYASERLSRCPELDTKDMDSLLELMRKDIKESFDGFDSPNTDDNAFKEQVHKVVNSTLDVYNTLLDEDSAAWSHMKKKRQIETSMDLIKTAETTAWLFGCHSHTFNSKQVKKENLELQSFLLQSVTQNLKFTLDKEEIGWMELPGGLSAEPSRFCKEEPEMGIGMTYRRMNKLLTPEQKESSLEQFSIVSDVIGVSLGEYNESYKLVGDNLTFRIAHPPMPKDAKRECVFLNWNNDTALKYGVWDTKGCEVRKPNEPNFTECECNHLTNFAILMDLQGKGFSETDDAILSLLSMMFCTLSSIALALIIITFLTVKSLRNRRNVITWNLALCLLCINILVQTGLKRLGTTVCTVISATLQYCVLSSFLWMLLEGLLLYRMVIIVFEKKPVRLSVLFGVAYGIPILLVGLSSASHHDLMIREDYCWPSSEKGLIWSVAAPVLIIICVNLIIFCLTLQAASNKMKNDKAKWMGEKTNLLRRLKGVISLMCLLGISWSVAYFYVPGYPQIAAYPFVVLNGLQGVFLFATQLAFNEQVKGKLLHLYKENRMKFTSVNSWGYFFSSTKSNSKIHPEKKYPEFTDTIPASMVNGTSICPTAPEVSSSERCGYVVQMHYTTVYDYHPFEVNKDA